jgi:hypothetical protein
MGHKNHGGGLAAAPSLNEEENPMNMPIEEAVRIQKALKPLGYMVHGYRDDRVSENGLVTVDLRPGGTFPFRESPNVPCEVGDVGVDESPSVQLSMDGVSDVFKD